MSSQRCYPHTGSSPSQVHLGRNHGCCLARTTCRRYLLTPLTGNMEGGGGDYGVPTDICIHILLHFMPSMRCRWAEGICVHASRLTVVVLSKRLRSVLSRLLRGVPKSKCLVFLGQPHITFFPCSRFRGRTAKTSDAGPARPKSCHRADTQTTLRVVLPIV